MIVNAIYHGLKQVGRVYRNGAIIFENSPIEFHVFEDGKFIIVGALTANSLPDGLYLDCSPDVNPTEWIDPILDGTTLTIRQAYSATLNGTTLEVK